MAPKPPRDDNQVEVTDVPSARRSVVVAELDGGLVLYDTASTSLATLDGTGSAVWSCIDGGTSVLAIASQLAEHYGAPPPRVLQDVVDLVAELVCGGFLEYQRPGRANV